MTERTDVKKSRKKYILLLFLLFMKIGLFTFGGGYAMISLIRREFIDRRKWVTAPEFTDMIAISESTPGPLAINSATYVGFKVGGFWGALAATVGVVIPSFVIIYLISLFFEQFLALAVVAAAFKGIQVAVAFLILSAGIKMFREMEKKPLTVAMALLVFAVMLLLDILALSFSSVYMILIGAGVGLFAYLLVRIREQKKRAVRAGIDGQEEGAVPQAPLPPSEREEGSAFAEAEEKQSAAPEEGRQNCMAYEKNEARSGGEAQAASLPKEKECDNESPVPSLKKKETDEPSPKGKEDGGRAAGEDK